MNLVHDFLQPLQTRLGSNRYFFGSDPSTLDCLAVGYLSLCYYPDLPHPWLTLEMTKGFGRVCDYLNDIRTPMLGRPVNAREVMAYTRSSGEENKTPESELPWGVVERGDLPWMSGFILDRAFDAIGWGRGAQIRKQRLQEREKAMDPADLERKRKMDAAIRSQRIRGTLTVVGGVAAFLGYCVWSGLVSIQFKDEEEEEVEEVGGGGPGGFGMAGAILGLSGKPMNLSGLEVEEMEDEEGLSSEEEEEIAEDIRAEEAEVDEAIAKDVEDHIEGKAE